MTDLLAANVARLAHTPHALPDTRDFTAELRTFTDSFQAEGVAAGDTITIARLPDGARVKDIAVYHGALGASTTLRCGDATDGSRYFPAASSAAAGVRRLSEIGGANFQVAGAPGSGTGTRDIRLTVGGAAATGAIRTVVTYAYC